MDRLVFVFLVSFVLRVSAYSETRHKLGPYQDDSQIQRPCGAVYDVNCVREYLYEHSKCKKTYGPAPDPFIRNDIKLYFASLNATVSAPNAVIGGLNGRIDEFYINKETDRLVMSIAFRNLSMSSDSVILRFHRRAKEPVVGQAPAFNIYPSVLITVVIPNLNDLQLDKAEFVPYIEQIPMFGVGPQVLVNAPDPQVALTVAGVFSQPAINVQEIFSMDSAFYPAQFIQYNLCDFGLKIL